MANSGNIPNPTFNSSVFSENKSAPSRVIVGTINNYEEGNGVTGNYAGVWEGGLEGLPAPIRKVMSYYVVGKEIGANGTKHLQCCFRFKNPIRLSTVNKLLDNKAWLANCKDEAAAIEYCKKDGNFQTSDPDYLGLNCKTGQGGGDRPPKPKGRLEEALDLMRATGTVTEVALTMTDVYVRNFRGLHAACAMMQEPRDYTKPENYAVYWLYGPTGIGKTHRVRDFCKEHELSLYTAPSDWGNWFTANYTGQDAILIDDHRCSDIKYSSLLKFIDIYAYEHPVKGGYVQINSTFIFITSCYHPADTIHYYPGITEDRQQLIRRITANPNGGIFTIDANHQMVRASEQWNPPAENADFVPFATVLPAEVMPTPPTQQLNRNGAPRNPPPVIRTTNRAINGNSWDRLLSMENESDDEEFDIQAATIAIRDSVYYRERSPAQSMFASRRFEERSEEQLQDKAE